MLFDGVCHLCSHSVQFILPRDPEGHVSFCPIQSETGSRLYREHGFDPEKPHTMLLLTPRGPFTQSDAVLELAGVLGGGWAWLRVFKILPKSFRDRLYHLVADNRYRLFGKEQQCWMPRPEWRKRFIS